MSEYTTIVSATYRILGESEDYAGTFSITVDENTTASELRTKIEKAVKQLDSVTDELGWALIHHLSRNVTLAQFEKDNPPEDPHEDEQTDHGGWEDH